MKTTSRKIVGNIFIILFVIILFFPKVLLAFYNPHLNFEACLSCHSQIPTPADIFNNQLYLVEMDINKKCEECHISYHSIADHPVGIKPKQKADLPLQGGNINCTTCHYCNSINTEFNEDMLRLSNSHGSFEERMADMCRKCHIGYWFKKK